MKSEEVAPEWNPFDIPQERAVTHAYAARKLQEVVAKWRDEGYLGVTETTRRLLMYWFNEDHKLEDGRFFRYYFCQREAIETLIYCHEILKVKKFIDLIGWIGGQMLYDPAIDKYPRYIFKMATGSGKTKVMTLAIAWSYFNSLKEENGNLTRNFLIIAPNVIVFERLKQDFEEAKIFLEDPVIPPEWKHEWDVKVILQDESVSDVRGGMIFLTNIQRLYEKKDKDEEDPVTALIGPKPKKEIQISSDELIDRILEFPNLMVLNDEAHHVHDPDLVWWQTIEKIHERSPLTIQLDFSATPKDQKGDLLPWIIVDYPLADAIRAGIVKRPIIGTVINAKEAASDKANVRYRPWIDGSINRWREYWKLLYEDVPRKEERKKPVLFIMANNTTEADDIAGYLETIPDLKNHVIIIHTDKGGEVSKKDLKEARSVCRQIDIPDNKYRAIVSVLMLREGWDVKNVTVILGLRPYTAKAKILPEQTVGRGLRLMGSPTSGFQEKVDIIGNSAFENFVRILEKEGVSFGGARIGVDKVGFENIWVDENKLDYDIEIPSLSPSLMKSSIDFNQIDVSKMPYYELLTSDEKHDKIKYEGKDSLTNKIIVRREWTLQIPENIEAVIAYYTKQILLEVNIPSRTSELAPKVKEFIEKHLFKEGIDLNEKETLWKLSTPAVKEAIIGVFKDAISKLSIKPQEVKIESKPIKLSETRAFPWSKRTFEARKTVFNKVPCDNQLESDFVAFLDRISDVQAFAKLERDKTKVYMEYIDLNNNFRLYYPDFAIKTKNLGMFLVETKGREDIAVALKDKRAKQWAKDATRLTGEQWTYIKIPEDLFRHTNAKNFTELVNHTIVRQANR